MLTHRRSSTKVSSLPTTSSPMPISSTKKTKKNHFNWEIVLITLATGPFMVAAGGISNIFLHRLAKNIQDAYAEAASIAEQSHYLTPKPIFYGFFKEEKC
uniref:Uncharacterized protein n=1 Tax=Gossypium raimondii TaxID=29730 RepID=A0A0D2S0K7_GOSRA|nr:hypothetical protein B456_012G096100 [Gossypium raimondii]